MKLAVSQIQDNAYLIGKNFFRQGEFLKAKDILQDQFLIKIGANDFKSTLDCLYMLIRIYTEFGNNDQIQNLLSYLKEYKALAEFANTNPKFNYGMGIYSYHSNQFDQAISYLLRAVQSSEQENSCEDLAYALIPLVNIYCEMPMQRLETAKFYFHRLSQLRHQVAGNLDLILAIDLAEVEVCILEKNFEEAHAKLFDTYEMAQDSTCKTFYTNTIFANLGRLYLNMGLTKNAQVFLQIAKRGINNQNYRRMQNAIDGYLLEIKTIEHRAQTKDNLNIKFLKRNVLLVDIGTEQNLIELGNQFVLIDMLYLFLLHVGQVYSKEDLVRLIWDSPYDPSHHDNLIYVNIRRIRTLFQREANFLGPTILRSKKGYYFNPAVTICID